MSLLDELKNEFLGVVEYYSTPNDFIMAEFSNSKGGFYQETTIVVKQDQNAIFFSMESLLIF